MGVMDHIIVALNDRIGEVAGVIEKERKDAIRIGFLKPLRFQILFFFRFLRILLLITNILGIYLAIFLQAH